MRHSASTPRRFAAALLALTLSLITQRLSSAARPALTPPLSEAVKESLSQRTFLLTVTLKDGKTRAGTAFFVAERGVAATTAALVKDGASATAHFQGIDGDVDVDVELTHSDTTIDLALLKVPVDDAQLHELKPVVSELSFDEIEPDAAAFAVTAHADAAPEVEDCTVSRGMNAAEIKKRTNSALPSFDESKWLHVTFKKDLDRGPIINANGKVIAVASTFWPATTTSVYATSAESLDKLLKASHEDKYKRAWTGTAKKPSKPIDDPAAKDDDKDGNDGKDAKQQAKADPNALLPPSEAQLAALQLNGHFKCEACGGDGIETLEVDAGMSDEDFRHRFGRKPLLRLSPYDPGGSSYRGRYNPGKNVGGILKFHKTAKVQIQCRTCEGQKLDKAERILSLTNKFITNLARADTHHPKWEVADDAIREYLESLLKVELDHWAERLNQNLIDKINRGKLPVGTPVCLVGLITSDGIGPDGLHVVSVKMEHHQIRMTGVRIYSAKPEHKALVGGVVDQFDGANCTLKNGFIVGN